MSSFVGVAGTIAFSILVLTCGATRAIFAGANLTSAVWISAILFDFDWSTFAL
jgi:hypothetical protein